MAGQKQRALVKNQTQFISSDFVIAEFCNAFSRIKFSPVGYAVRTFDLRYAQHTLLSKYESCEMLSTPT